ncbi:MAG: ANTAR domain-containing protein [Pseudomonadota bacterium]
MSQDLRASLEGSYNIQVISEASFAETVAATADAIDIVLFAKPVLDDLDLQKISGMLEDTPIPVLVFVDSDPEKMARSAIRAGVTSFVVDGLVAARVPTLIEVTMERFKLSEALRSELLKSQEELAARKVIERAKGLLMDKKQLSEQEAYRSLRELAMRQSKPIKDVAETLLMYSDILP